MVKTAATELTKIGSCFDHQGDRVIVKATPENQCIALQCQSFKRFIFA